MIYEYVYILLKLKIFYFRKVHISSGLKKDINDPIFLPQNNTDQKKKEEKWFPSAADVIIANEKKQMNIYYINVLYIYTHVCI